MFNACYKSACIIAALLACSSSPLFAQEVVHALAGTVTSIDPQAGIIQINTDDGSSGQFKAYTKAASDADYSLDRKLSEDATPAKAFEKKTAHVIVFYYGDGSIRTAVALEDLGGGPLEKDTGVVERYDRHRRVLTIKTDSGSDESFEISPKSVAETSVGAVDGEHFEPQKGEQVRITASPGSGTENALFINAS